ncbi:MAG: hypothetical protein ACRDMH_11475 [Solirubrobacterales bacterium]
MSARCLVCGAEAWRGHHPSGRDPGSGRYLDPRFTVPACHDHHELFHDDWRALGIEDSAKAERGARPLTFVERAAWFFRRGSLLAGRLAAAYPEHPWIARLAEALKRRADELASDIAARDRRDPGWRRDPSFYPAEA